MMIMTDKKKAAKTIVHPLATSVEHNDRYFSRAVGKSFQLLDLLNRAGAALSLNELASQVKLTRSSTFRLLYTLQKLHYVFQDGEGKYSIAIENWISSSRQVANALLKVAPVRAKELHAKFHESVSLAVFFQNHIEVVQVFESPQAVRMANSVGDIIPPHASSLGKAVTAFQTEEARMKLIKSYGIRRFTEHTITDQATLMRELATIREKGFAYEEEEAFLDGCCVGCPIFGNGEAAVAAISISMPKSRLPNGEKLKIMISDLQMTARKISEDLNKHMHSVVGAEPAFPARR
jgi:IclR family acetate operon transcriptional repressor